MTNFTENNNGSSSSSPTPSEVLRDFNVFEDLYAKGNWSSNNYDTAIEIDDESSSEDEKEFNPIDQNEESRPVVKCSVCDFDINVSALQTYGSYAMICPVCEEHSSLRSRRKRAWYARNQKKYGALNVDLTLNDKKPAPRENKHEPLSPCKNNVYLSSSEDFFSDEDTISSSASDATFVAKSDGEEDARDTTGGDEQNVEERSNKAAFAQELVISALFSE
ncbi:uncharacterized protein LOC131656040 [Vicia villosa]|uniref:uncharacterized protein LOC131656040 n=1 Tax=Vicia villosa TaxID=3911 RepID=UPI00273B445C|nr:uncharacterized protein LOC131656040 [Vicia villosa]XP_058781804.1 uncharacterized protein LOC131656040 [Vicia villosa]